MTHTLPAPIASLVAAGQPADFGSVEDEWRAAAETCAVFPAVHRASAVATGDDRVDFLQGMLTNDVRSLGPGQGLDAAFLTDSAKVVSVLRVSCDEERLVLDSMAWGMDPLLQGLERYIIADDVDLETDPEITPLACLEGPTSLRVAAAAFACERDPGSLARAEYCTATLHGAALRLSRCSELNRDGVLVSGPASLRAAVVDAATAAGALTAGLEALHLRRVECGIPWIGVDMGEDTLLMEIGLTETINRTKGCYLGQEVVERVSARGQVNRTWTGFLIDGSDAEIGAGPFDIESDTGSTVGRLTSVAWSYAANALIGVGLLHRKGRDARELRITEGEQSVALHRVEFPVA